MLEHSFVLMSDCGTFSKSQFESVIELFERYHKLAAILKEKCGKGRLPSHRTPRSFLSLNLVSSVLPVLFR